MEWRRPTDPTVSTVGALWLAAKGAALYLRQLRTPEVADHARRLSAAGGSEERTETLVHDIAEVVDETLDGVRRIADLVAGFGRLAEPEDPGPRERVRVAALVDECLAALPRRSGHRDHPVQRDAFADCETLVCREDLRSALLNILAYLCSTNRHAERADGAIRLRLEEAAGHPLLVLSDDGLHLSPEARSRLFDPRVEVDATRTHDAPEHQPGACASTVGAERSANLGGER